MCSRDNGRPPQKMHPLCIAAPLLSIALLPLRRPVLTLPPRHKNGAAQTDHSRAGWRPVAATDATDGPTPAQREADEHPAAGETKVRARPCSIGRPGLEDDRG